MTYNRESPKQIAERLHKGIPPTPVFQDEKKPVEGAITISTIYRRAA